MLICVRCDGIAGWVRVLMASDNPDEKGEEPVVPEEPPPPPPPEPEPSPQVPEKAPEKAPEEIWMEDYDDLIGPDEEPKPRKRKNKHWGATIATIVVIIILVVWTLLSPKIMTQVGPTYVNSPTYASWGNNTGYREIWAGNTTWALSIRGSPLTEDNRSMEVQVLLTKVHEKPGNWFFRGTSAKLQNVTVYLDDGTYLASMSNWSDVGFGLMATVPIAFASSGTYSLYVFAQFTVYEVMRIGFFPLEAVQFEKVYVDEPVVVE